MEPDTRIRILGPSILISDLDLETEDPGPRTEYPDPDFETGYPDQNLSTENPNLDSRTEYPDIDLGSGFQDPDLGTGYRVHSESDPLESVSRFLQNPITPTPNFNTRLFYFES